MTTPRHSWFVAPFATVVAVMIVTGPFAPARGDETAAAIDPLDLLQVSRLAARESGGHRVWRVRGVVTAVAAETVALQHGADACWVRFVNATVEPAADESPARRLAPGLLVEAEGEVERGGFAPTLAATRLEILGPAPLPEPLLPDTARLFSGSDNGLRVAVEGVVQGVRGGQGAWRLIVAADSRRIAIDLDGRAFPERPAGMVDTRVRLAGVARAVANTRGQFMAPTVLVSRAEDLAVVAPQPSFGWQAPVVPLGHVARFERRERPGHRVQAEGIVTHAPGGRLLVLQEGLDGLEVETATRTEAQRGERVRVSGFVDTAGGSGRMVEAMVSRLDPEGVPAAEPITPSKVLAINRSAAKNGRPARPSTFDRCLVRFPARLMAIERVPAGLRLALDDEGTLVEATLAGDPGPVAGLAAGSRLDVTGILRLVPEPLAVGASRPPQIRQAEVVLRTPADVVLVSPPAWWTPGRMAAAVAALAAVLAGSLVWVWLLRRQVARQSRRLAAEMSSRTAAALEYQVTLRERTHLAANLHDTVLQVLAGIGYQLKACRLDAERRGENASPRLASAEGMVADCVGQLRGTLWTLRTLPTGGRGFAGSLADLVGRMGEGRPAAIELDTSGDLDRVDDSVAGQLLLVVQEAVANAVNHARPDRVEVSVTVEAGGGIDLVVRDDGDGFDPADHAGPAQGHFGLEGIQDRVARVGGTVAIASRPGAGTQVTVRVPAGSPPAPVIHQLMEAADA